MTDEEALALLEKEGYSNTFVHEDDPNKFYPDHTHEKLTAHLFLEGSMDLEIEGKMKHYEAGDRVDVPAGAVHNAKVGPEGCRFAVGEK